ncbi:MULTISPECIES: hypothetical protein [Marinobacter]|uniref:hypothetical protein n=1 Tax=Marinobacter TaxID=2742 RepID=UPI003B43BE03|nr:hypothetical protein PBN92_05715 [Marinobacter alkaliphilus]
MSDAPSREKELFEGLKALSDSAFPKECATCGRVYRSPQDFVQQSDDIAGRSGLKLGYDDDDRPVVELFRNCVCGSTLMDFFSDRRETSRAGLKRRQVFGKLLAHLESRGMDNKTARHELLKLMRGDASEKIESLGIQLKARSYKADDGNSNDPL